MEPDAPEPTDGVEGISIEDHLTIVRIGGDLRDRLLATLEGAGWQIVGEGDLPSPDPGFLQLDSLPALEAEVSMARQLAELADAELAASLSDLAASSAELDRSERRRAELDGLGDLVTSELAVARHVEDSTERLSRIVEGAAGLGFDQSAPALAIWLDQIVSGEAQTDPTALELAAQRLELEHELAEGAGSVERSPQILAAHAHRHELRSLIVELEGMLERGLTAESRHLIESAHTERLRAEEGGRRRGHTSARDALASEEAALARFGYASFPDYQISTSTRSVGEHAEAALVGVRDELRRADHELEAARASAETMRRSLQTELEEVAGAIEALVAGRSIEGIVARPDALQQLGEQVADAAEAELERGDRHRSRITELQPVVDDRTQTAAAVEGEVESLDAAHRALTHDHQVADAAVELARIELCERLEALVAAGPTVVQADVAWLPGDLVVAMFEGAAAAGPVVWCTDRVDTAAGRAVEPPSRWWRFRRRARQTVLTG